MSRLTKSVMAAAAHQLVYAAAAMRDHGAEPRAFNRAAAIANPTGGAIVDAETRSAIGLILAALRQHGLMAT